MSDSRMLEAFDEAASDFERLAPYLWSPLATTTVERSRPMPGEKVLDACCGTGASALPTAERVGPRGRVDAVDLSSAMIGRLVARAAGISQLRPVVADVSTWREADYDLVQSVMGIFFLEDMTAETRRLVERVRPGGRVAFTIWRRRAMVECGQRLVEAVTQVKQEPPPRRRANPLEAIDTAEPYTAWLTQLGLVDVEVTEHELVVPADPVPLWLVVTGSGFRSMLRGLDGDQVTEVRQRYLSAFVDQAVTDAGFLVGTGRQR